MSPLLFAYGTLLPGQSRWPILDPLVDDEGAPDSAGGRLYDTGRGYPAAVFDGAGAIHGRVFQLRADLITDALDVLDEVEGAVAGGYQRVSIITHHGRTTWAYEYGGSGLQLDPIAGGSWVDHAVG